MALLPVGTTVRAESPATSANLGPGYDTLGLALDWTDCSTLTVTDAADRALVSGEGAADIPTDAGHLVLQCARQGLKDLGAAAPGLLLEACNTIPHGRGLGSSSAAIVTGLLLAWGLARPDSPPDRNWLLRWANKFEGHPDNVAAAIHGGFVIAFGEGDGVQVAAGELHPDLGLVVFIPETGLSTGAARGLLPASVSHHDAVTNSGRCALLVHALARQPELLLPATEDRLHQRYRATAMPASADLLNSLRRQGYPAVISGAGSSVLVIGEGHLLQGLAADEIIGFHHRRLRVGRGARLVGGYRCDPQTPNHG